MSRKPEGFEQFQKLLGKLSRVPKRELDNELAKSRKKKAGKRNK